MSGSKFTQKQLEIIDTTIDYIVKNGVQSFTLRNIASELGIKQPTLYSHFSSKEEILDGVFEVYKISMEKHQDNLRKLKASKLTKIKLFFRKMCEFIQYRTDYMNLVTFELFQFKDLYENEFSTIYKNMEDIINEAEDDFELSKDTDYNWILTTIQGVIHVYLKQKLLSENFDVISNAKKYWDTLEKTIKNSS